MFIEHYGKRGAYYQIGQEYQKENGRAREGAFSSYVNCADERNRTYGKYGMGTEQNSPEEETDTEEEKWEEKMRKWDEEMKRIREENRRERERLMEERFRKKRIQRKLMEKLALKKYLARQDEVMQMNVKISLERSVGEDVYIEKAPLSKSLSVAEIMAICTKY